MTERFTSDLLFIVIVLLIAAALGFLIGYFWRKPKIVIREDASESGESTTEEFLSSQTATEPELIFNAGEAGKVMGKKIVPNDLKIVEGIGPKIEEILKKNKINTWNKLAVTSKGTISKLLISEGGEKYKLHDPETWPMQAELAFEGKWEALKKLQDELQGGRKV